MIAVSLNVGGGVWPPYQTGKTVHVHAKHYKHEDGRTAPGVCGNGSVPLSHSGNVVIRIGIHTHTHTHTHTICGVPMNRYLNGVWVKCVTRTRVGKPALGFYESLKIIFGSKINAVKAQK